MNNLITEKDIRQRLTENKIRFESIQLFIMRNITQNADFPNPPTLCQYRRNADIINFSTWHGNFPGSSLFLHRDSH